MASLVSLLEKRLKLHETAHHEISNFYSETENLYPLALSQVKNTRKDILSAFSPELLVKIVSNLPLSSFLDLAQASSHFRSFLKNKKNAALICNEALESRHLNLTRKLKAQLIRGWLVPMDIDLDKVQRDARLYLMRMRGGWKGTEHSDRQRCWDGVCHACDESPIRYDIKLNTPGPQFLYWLDSEAPRHELVKGLGRYYGARFCLDKINGFDYHGQRVPRKIREIAWFYDLPPHELPDFEDDD